MIDFTKKLGKIEVAKKIDPIEIYDTLDRSSETGPLRPAQEYVLKQWYSERRNDKDLIVKLHTGEGKTLIGLLLLLSKANAGEGPCIYVCPNIYLANQVFLEAGKFGIPVCSIADGNTFPDEFINGEKILITHVQKLFNGKTIFGLGSQSVGVNSIILDDSHACIDSIKNAISISIPNRNDDKTENEAYSKLKYLFAEDLVAQGEGSYYEIDNASSNAFLPIPYWSWIDKKSEVLKILVQYANDKYIKFAWPIMKDRMEFCRAFISSNKFEISPLYIPIFEFGTFSNARQRILMSATTQDDSFFINGLGFSVDAVLNPLVNPNANWSGEKMIIVPSLISDKLDREKIISVFAGNSYPQYGAISIVPSFKKVGDYTKHGALFANRDDITKAVTDLKKGIFGKMVVFANRYDGIDLPDYSCRILIIDSLPFFDSLYEKYEEQCRTNSDLINTKMAQKIEQGIGRSVRGEKDYSVVVIIGSDIVKFIRSIATRKFFSKQTQKQIDIGLEIAKMADEELKDEKDDLTCVMQLIKQSLTRDSGWKSYYQQEMNDANYESSQIRIYEILSKEKQAIDALVSCDRKKANDLVQEIVNSLSDEHEKGWYLQLMALFSYFDSKDRSNILQISAFKMNSQLLKPKNGIMYEKINFMNHNRINMIQGCLSKFSNYQEAQMHYNSILDDLSFGIEADKFEFALKEIGNLLGFESQRPDKEIRKGPDNLWCIEPSRYIMFECKSEVEMNRKSIYKKEAGQMDQHCAWFVSEYGQVYVKRIIIFPTKEMSYDAYFSFEVEIMKNEKLIEFKNSIKNFLKEFQVCTFPTVDNESIAKWLEIHKLDIDSIISKYAEKPNQLPKKTKATGI